MMEQSNDAQMVLSAAPRVNRHSMLQLLTEIITFVFEKEIFGRHFDREP